MFDINGQEISLLSDADLRDLIGRLCEAELGRNGLSPLAVTYGGDQNAADGGIDVRVATTADMPAASALARRNVGFQVKAEDMPRSKVFSEMYSGGVLRASIRELADISGAYIIVSSKGSVSYSALRERRRAMSDAIADLPNANDLYLDFYDRNRIATWVRVYPEIVAWVRERIGRPLSGWRPYGDWAGSNEGIEGAYLVDDSLRIQGPKLSGQNVSVVEGVNRLRSILSSEHGIVRLVGLSGTGKTRLAQALFDGRVGEGTLPPELPIYTNLSDDPKPQPVAVATELVAQRHRQILVVDNCPPELHNRLSEICRTPESRLSLLTIEYDVREDQPEATDVFELQPSSDDLIEKLLLRRVEGLSQVNAHSIASFAGGNARVALALATTLERGESVASLTNAELFERLFRQRHEESDSLLSSAQACSLTYSFNGGDTSNGTDAEVAKLAAAIGKDVRALHADIVKLQKRDLIQQRGIWRAVLPHAIANRLAEMALDSFFPGDLDKLFAAAPPRLIKSISRRLGFLHTSKAAQRIVGGWLAEDGWLGRVEELDETGKAMLGNVAPVAPVSALDAIERAVRRQRQTGAHLSGEEFRTLLLSLAFNSDLFDRSVSLIVDLIEDEEPGRYANQVRNSFPSMFQLYLSGTHATVAQRIRVIDDLLRSASQVRREIGFAALESMLESYHFSSFHHFEFGGRPRDYGFFPKTREDVLHWFNAALALCDVHDARDLATSSRIRTILSHKLRGLWSSVKMFDEIDTLCRRFDRRRFWPEGWTAIRSIRSFGQDPLPADEAARLAAIESAISPESLPEIVRAKVFHNARTIYDDIDDTDYEAQFARKQCEIVELGRATAKDCGALDEILPELMACDTGITLGPFAKGFVDETTDHSALWKRFVAAFLATDQANQSAEFLACYLYNLQSVDGPLVEGLLQEVLHHPVLCQWFPEVQTRVSISSEGFIRLKECLARGDLPSRKFIMLAYRGTGGLDDGQIRELIPVILPLQDGLCTAVEIVSMRLPHDKREAKPVSPELCAAGRLIADAFDFNEKLGRDEYSLCQVFEACLSSAEGIPVVKRLIGRLNAKHSRRGFISFELHHDVLGSLVAAQPLVVLNELFASETSGACGAVRGIYGHYDHLASPFNRTPEDVLLPWCDEVPTVRYPLAASIVKAFDKPHNANQPSWNGIALALLEHAPDRVEVLKSYINQLHPMGWVGSQAAAWETNVHLLDTFEDHPDASLAAFARGERERLMKTVYELRQKELESERRENERFE